MKAETPTVANIDMLGEQTQNGLKLVGGYNMLQALADALTNMTNNRMVGFKLLLPQTPINGHPLKQMSIELRPRGKVSIQVVEDTLHISGSIQFLAMLADNIRFLASNVAKSAKVASTLKVEHYPGHIFLDGQSSPLTIACRDLRVAA